MAIGTGAVSQSVALGDLDGDGDLDAMVANSADEPNTVWINDGNGTFENSGQALGNSKSYSVALGDLDNDGDLDAMITNNKQPNTVWTNDGNGTFASNGQALGNSQSYSVALGDLDETEPWMPWSQTTTRPTPSGPTTATRSTTAPPTSTVTVWSMVATSRSS